MDILTHNICKIYVTEITWITLKEKIQDECHRNTINNMASTKTGHTVICMDPRHIESHK